MSRHFPLRYLLAVALLCFGVNGHGQNPEANVASSRELLACVSDQPFPPFTYPDREGLLQYLLRHAVEAQGLSVRFIVEPRARCLYNLKAGHYEWLPFALDTPTLRENVSFPMRDGVVDPRFQFGVTSLFVVTPLNSEVRWDGQQFLSLQGPLLYRRGAAVMEDWLAKHRLTGEPANSALITAKMMLAGRSNAALMGQSQVDDLQLRNPEIMQQLQVLSPAVETKVVVTAASKDYASAHPQEARAIWDEMLRLKESPGYLELQRQLAREMPSVAP
jgi:polar amino acid transport system substrate-binding protein